MESDDQPSLFDLGNPWDEHWQGMPEFVQPDVSPIKSILVHFETRADLDAFSALIGQRVLMTTRSIWFPEAEIGRYTNKRFIDSDCVTPSSAPDEDDDEP
jgi:hypothetical protein